MLHSFAFHAVLAKSWGLAQGIEFVSQEEVQ